MVNVVFKRKNAIFTALSRPLSKFSRFVFIINLVAAIYTLVAYLAIQIPPSRVVLAGFLTLSIPVMLFLHLLLLIYWLRKSPTRTWVSVLVLVAGFPLLQRTFAFHPFKTGSATEADAATFKVLSYNTQLFAAHDYFNNGSKEKPKQALAWIKDSKADILCLQEFYNQDGNSDFDAISQLANEGYNSYMTPLFRLNSDWQGFYGVAIFSKFPIIKRGDIVFDRNTLNKGVYADLLIDNDTIRVFNIHLLSMSIQIDSLSNRKEISGIKAESKNIINRLKKGLRAHSRQAALVDWYVRNSPHPVIVCGDFNEIPYTYTYHRIRRRLNNAFEDAGTGFGFTFNNSKLFFLRIDNQFYDKRLQVHSFQTHREASYSDHFPISGVYSIPADAKNKASGMGRKL